MISENCDDWELLRSYISDRSESSFARIVERHVNFVYGTAFRQVRNVHLAEDVTQAVFIVLAKKADSMRKGIILSSWLFRTARFAASDLLKHEQRRLRRESEMQESEPPGEPAGSEAIGAQEVANQLDDALASLAEADRRAVLLRFFEQKSLREVADVFRIQEDAAKKRISRALDKMRDYLRQRGVDVGSTVILASIASESVRAAPLGLAGTVTSVAVGNVRAGTVANSVLKWMIFEKFWLASLVSVGLAFAFLVISFARFSMEDPVALHDLSRNFSLEKNPNGVWSYGSKTEVGGAFTHLAFGRKTVPGSWEYRAGAWPAIYFNNSPSTISLDRGRGVYAPDAVWFAAGENGTAENFGAIRFTVPEGAAGKYQIESRVRSGLIGRVSSDADFHVVCKGRELFGVNQPPGATNWIGYTNILILMAGDEIDLLVGRGEDENQPGSVLEVECRISALSLNETASSAGLGNDQDGTTFRNRSSNTESLLTPRK